MASSSGGGLWSALDALSASSPPPLADAFALVLGSAGGGKSGLVAALAQAPQGAAPRGEGREARNAPPASAGAGDSTTTPTVALEYTALRNAAFATAAAAAAAAAASAASSPAAPAAPPPPAPLPRELAHLWELGGSSLALANLCEMPLTATRLPSAVVVLALDLSRPGDLCATASRWLAVVRRRADDVLRKKQRPAGAGAGAGAGVSAAADAAGADGSAAAALATTRARLRAGFAQRGGQRVATAPAPAVGAAGAEAAAPAPTPALAPFSADFVLATLPEHPDWASLLLPAGALLPMQSIVVGTKWDRLCDEDAPKRRAVLAALRFVGLCAGAHVVCTARGDKDSLAAFRSLFLHAAFGAEPARGMRADEAAALPLCIPAGADSLDAILAALGGGGGVASPGGGGGSGGGNLRSVGAAGAQQQVRLALSRAELEAAAPAPGSGGGGGGAGAGAGTPLPGFASRLDKFSARVRLFYRASDPTPADAEDAAAIAAAEVSAAAGGSGGGGSGGGGGGEEAGSAAAVAFSDEAATQYPEPRIDEIRLRKAQALAAYLAEAKEKERRANLEAKAIAKGAEKSAAGPPSAAAAGRSGATTQRGEGKSTG
jgi:hypothetical protein